MQIAISTIEICHVHLTTYDIFLINTIKIYTKFPELIQFIPLTFLSSYKIKYLE